MSDRLTQGERVAGFAGLALILVMFLFAWYGVDVPGGASINGFDAFDAFDDWVNIILVFAAFSGMALAVFGSSVARVPFSLSATTAVLGAVSAIIILIYLISPPSFPAFGGSVGIEVDLGRKVGVWLGLICAIALAAGGYLAMQDEGVTFGDAGDRFGGGGA